MLYLANFVVLVVESNGFFGLEEDGSSIDTYLRCQPKLINRRGESTEGMRLTNVPISSPTTTVQCYQNAMCVCMVCMHGMYVYVCMVCWYVGCWIELGWLLLFPKEHPHAIAGYQSDIKPHTKQTHKANTRKP